MTTGIDRQQLALFGGDAHVRRSPSGEWPLTTEADARAVLGVLDSGVLVSDRTVRTPVEDLERAWAEYLGVAHCVGVSNGTTALEIALLAEGIGVGDEVIVPALSFVATAMAVTHVGAVPVYADVRPDTFNLDPTCLDSLVTPRTRAIVPVHLHGLSAEMGAIETFAARHGLVIVEDAAQAHGARLDGRLCGARGHTAAFSLQMTKNLPTCGEGGLIVTDDAEVANQARLLRQFGERIKTGVPRRYVSYRLGFNAKLNNVQAAYTLSQLERFSSYHQARSRNVREFLDALGGCVGLRLPRAAAGFEHAWHILRFRVAPQDVGVETEAGVAREQVMRALRAEGVPVSRYQVLALPDQPALRQLTTQDPTDWSEADRVIDTTFTLQQRHLRPDAGPLLEEYAEAFTKVFASIDRVLAHGVA